MCHLTLSSPLYRRGAWSVERPVREAGSESRRQRQSLDCFPWCCWLTAAARARMLQCPAVPCYAAPPAHAGLLLLPQLPPPTTSLPTPRARGSGETARYSGPTEPGRGSTWRSRGGHDKLHTRQTDACPTLYQHGCGHTAPRGKEEGSFPPSRHLSIDLSRPSMLPCGQTHATPLSSLAPVSKAVEEATQSPQTQESPSHAIPERGPRDHITPSHRQSEALSDSGWVDLGQREELQESMKWGYRGQKDSQPSPDSRKQSSVTLEPSPAICVHGERFPRALARVPAWRSLEETCGFACCGTRARVAPRKGRPGSPGPAQPDGVQAWQDPLRQPGAGPPHSCQAVCQPGYF